MSSSNKHLTEKEELMVSSAIGFLVPYVHSIVNLLSEIEIPINDFKYKLNELYLNIDSEDNGKIEASATHNSFNINILYTGTRSFVLTIKGVDKFDGFSFMETNKGMNIHDDLCEDNVTISAYTSSLFIKEYKSPYLVSDIYKDFLKKGSSFI